MKKILSISDLHGKTIWKTFADIKHLLTAEPDAAGFGPFEPEYYKYVFLGDYVDSFSESNDTIRENLLEIIRFKTLYPNNVVLLWGNHDVEYYLNQPWLPLKTAISGFRPEMHYDLYEIFDKNINLFQVAFQFENYLFSHAGVHFGWFHHVFTKAIKDKGWNDLSVADQINEAFNQRIDCVFDVDHYRGGYKKVGGPLWCDKRLMDKKPLRNAKQICGHNIVNDITTININDSTSITFCDVLHHKNAYYVVNI